MFGKISGSWRPSLVFFRQIRTLSPWPKAASLCLVILLDNYIHTNCSILDPTLGLGLSFYAAFLAQHTRSHRDVSYVTWDTPQDETQWKYIAIRFHMRRNPPPPPPPPRLPPRALCLSQINNNAGHSLLWCQSNAINNSRSCVKITHICLIWD